MGPPDILTDAWISSSPLPRPRPLLPPRQEPRHRDRPELPQSPISRQRAPPNLLTRQLRRIIQTNQGRFSLDTPPPLGVGDVREEPP